jgi:hypothetical protein
MTERDFFDEEAKRKTLTGAVTENPAAAVRALGPLQTILINCGIKLNTETNTPAMEKRILQAAHKALKRHKLTAFFEHGQWWVEHLPSGAQWSVCDASGPSCPDGFDFEQVTQGSEE